MLRRAGLIKSKRRPERELRRGTLQRIQQRLTRLRAAQDYTLTDEPEGIITARGEDARRAPITRGIFLEERGGLIAEAIGQGDNRSFKIAGFAAKKGVIKARARQDEPRSNPARAARRLRRRPERGGRERRREDRDTPRALREKDEFRCSSPE